MKTKHLFFYTLLTTFLLCSCKVSGGNNNPDDPVDPTVDPTLVSLELSGNYQTEFKVNDVFNYDGLVVSANYSDESSVTLSKDEYQISTPDMSAIGEQDVTVTYLDKNASYTITISEQEQEDFDGYMHFDFYQIDIQLNDNDKYYINPGVKDKDGKEIEYEPGEFPFTFSISDESIIEVSRYGGIKSKKASCGTSVITCTYTEKTSIQAKCTVNIVNTVKEKAWVRLDDYDSLKEKDIVVFAAPTYGLTASLDTLHSKLNPVESTFSNDKKTITSLGTGTIEFYVAKEIKNDEEYFTLEAQTGEYLVCTNEGKVKLDSSTNMNRFWDIHSNVDLEEGTGSLDDGAVIESSIESFGYFMYNVAANYFTTYVDNSLRPGVMELPFLYRLQEI